MRKIIGLLLLFMLPLLASASGYQDQPPREVLIFLDEAGALQDYIEITISGTERWGFALTAQGERLHGFRYKDGLWVGMFTTMLPSELRGATFVRQEAWDVQPDGGIYRSARGFSVAAYGADGTETYLSWRWNGVDFQLTGWKYPKAYAGEVMLDGGFLRYCENGPVVTKVTAGELPDWPVRFAELPLTPEQGKAMQTREAADSLFPAYSLQWQGNVSGQAFVMVYTRVEDGLLYVRTSVEPTKGEGGPWALVAMPLALTEAYAAQMDVPGTIEGGVLSIYTDSAIDAERTGLPEGTRVLQASVGDHFNAYLTEDAAGTRRVYISRYDEGMDEYSLRGTQALPDDAEMELEYDGQVWRLCLSWEKAELRACYTLTADDGWQLTCLEDYRAGEFWRAGFCGWWAYQYPASSREVKVGAFAGADLFTAELTANPADLLTLDRTGWAVVVNPDPDDRLNLRAEPSRESRSLGKFYNRTPVRVLEQQGDWCRVAIGTDGTLNGWMMTEYLCFGERMDSIGAAFPQLMRRDEYEGRLLYADASKQDTRTFATGDAAGNEWIIGVADDMYILMNGLGEIAYVPQSWMWGGNG